ncbi:hypothetical protein RFI_13815 [Reticulomyxa filosa]|uniref:Uncharacterized protein n=1 Tax=Reticulomyxa filosa TaxID=46433 RepID=X6NBL5_RETFI|nr:hypothetical protein RFI_13815 [Reticulomyxa filosa]|eukprot:ETO23366.1 hypothetical protein RFI_13815 [Reticulomyxa filosa]
MLHKNNASFSGLTLPTNNEGTQTNNKIPMQSGKTMPIKLVVTGLLRDQRIKELWQSTIKQSKTIMQHNNETCELTTSLLKQLSFVFSSKETKLLKYLLSFFLYLLAIKLFQITGKIVQSCKFCLFNKQRQNKNRSEFCISQKKMFKKEETQIMTTVIEPLRQVDSDLIEACLGNRPEDVRSALEKGANVGVQFRQTLEEVTPLILASTKGYAEIVKVLLDFTPDVNAKTSFGHATALLQAVSNEHIGCVDILISKGANVNQGDKLGRTPLMDAAENGVFLCVCVCFFVLFCLCVFTFAIIRKQTNTYKKKKKIGNKEIVKLLIKNKADLNGEDNQRRTPLSYCLDFVTKDNNKYFDIAYQFVFEHHCDPAKKGRSTNRTFLHCAAARGDLETCKKLVEELHVNVAEVDNMGYTAINYARKAGHAEVADYLQAQAASGCCLIL